MEAHAPTASAEAPPIASPMIHLTVMRMGEFCRGSNLRARPAPSVEGRPQERPQAWANHRALAIAPALREAAPERATGAIRSAGRLLLAEPPQVPHCALRRARCHERVGLQGERHRPVAVRSPGRAAALVHRGPAAVDLPARIHTLPGPRPDLPPSSAPSPS